MDNIDLFNLTDKIEVVNTDGINGISINKNDTIVLSGMGTKTIIDILSNKELSDTIIVSSNNNLEELRRFMVDIGYCINDEVYVVEHNIHYVIIEFITGYKKYSDYDYILGPIVINDNEYKKYILNKYTDLFNKIPNNHMKLKKYYQGLVNYINS